MTSSFILEVYERLYRDYGSQHWWPGETPLEVIVGAVLTQNTAWSNVEKAIQNLKNEGMLDLEKLMEVRIERLSKLIRPSGYFNVKAGRLKEVIKYIVDNGGIDNLLHKETSVFREELLALKGVGKETADSVLLYAFGKPVFVVDAYTKRIFSRLELLTGSEDYDEVQNLFEKNLEQNAQLYNEYHALIVRLGKECCKKNHPLCAECSLEGLCHN